MDVETRWRLRRAWGLCGRHGWGALATEAAFRGGFLHGPAVLYLDLMERGFQAFRVRGALQTRRLARRLRATGPCMMCEMGLDQRSRGAARQELIAEGRDPSQILRFADKTRRYWRKTLCGRCVGHGSFPLCRPHLLEETSRGFVDDPAEHCALVKYILEHLRIYKQSFVWGYHGTETEEDEAALISAVGWCSGWQTWLSFGR